MSVIENVDVDVILGSYSRNELAIQEIEKTKWTLGPTELDRT